jgi:hypothetical protein
MSLRHFMGLTFKQIQHKRQTDNYHFAEVWAHWGREGRRNVSPEQVFFILSLRVLSVPSVDLHK